MSSWLLYALSGACAMSVGLGSVFVHDDWVRKILGANIASSGVFLVLVAIAARTPLATADPVPHALVLTGIVVSVSATAVGLVLARRLAEVRACAEEESAEPPASRSTDASR